MAQLNNLLVTGFSRFVNTINGDISGDAGTVNGHAVNSDVPANAKFTDTTYSVATTSANGLMSSTDKSKLDSALAFTFVKNV